MCRKKPRVQNVLHLVASRTGGAGASVAKLLLASGAKDFRLARDQVRVYITKSGLRDGLDLRKKKKSK